MMMQRGQPGPSAIFRFACPGCRSRHEALGIENPGNLVMPAKEKNMERSVNEMMRQVRGELGAPGQVLGANSDTAPRFELFHAANSICSQKVRTLLAHHEIPYVSHPVDMFKGQNYIPSYVRLRLRGCERLAIPLASAHSGSTSASTGGCDAVVVPTLVDLKEEAVLVDSKLICIYLDDLFPESSKLRPAKHVAAIDAEMAIVDNLPNYQMLLGKRPNSSGEAVSRNGYNGPAFSMAKVERCDKLLTEFASDPDLVAAYSAKRAKELQAAQQLFSPDAMQVAYAKAETACKDLDTKLRGRDWLFGEKTTMADLFWMIELLRMKNVGAAGFWEGGKLPQVERFVSVAESLPSIRSAILDWPGALF
jgi:2,5-dichlorohydroquinone reductive dechlorinase